MVQSLQDKQVKLWQLLIAAMVQLVGFGVVIGRSDAKANALVEKVAIIADGLEEVKRDVIRIDTEGSKRWANGLPESIRSAEKLENKINSIESQVVGINVKIERLIAVSERQFKYMKDQDK